MKTMLFVVIAASSWASSCMPSSSNAETFQRSTMYADSATVSSDSNDQVPQPGQNLHRDHTLTPVTKNTNHAKPADLPEKIMQFAETLVGVPYRYGSTDPSVGLDCSGFITHVFNHFDIEVPRSSIDFTNEGIEVNEKEVKRGDIILFTGTNHKERFVGHMGLVVSATNNELSFIHSTSGKAMSVTITPLNEYYRRRLVGFRRLFN